MSICNCDDFACVTIEPVLHDGIILKYMKLEGFLFCIKEIIIIDCPSSSYCIFPFDIDYVISYDC